MGVSTNAVLFWGYCWDDEVDGAEFSNIDECDEGEWAEAVLRRRDVVDPWSMRPSFDNLPYAEQRAAGDKWCDENRAAIDAWHGQKKGVEAEFGCHIGWHCSGECPMPYVTVVGSGASARRGYPKSVESLAVQSDWREKIDRFCAELNITPPEGQQPQWWLVSYWG